MSDPETTNIHPVACESCRAKKCKCDRALPRCGQCSKSRTRCTYPQSFKRGFPEGYLAGLEQRLLQTEIALFKTLSQPSNSSVDNNSWDLENDDDDANDDAVERAFRDHATKQTKNERPREWTNLPLRTRKQRRLWFELKAEQMQIGSSFNFSTHQSQQQQQQQQQSQSISMHNPSLPTTTPRSSSVTTEGNNNPTTNTPFSSSHWSSPPIHPYNPVSADSASVPEWPSQPFRGTGSGSGIEQTNAAPTGTPGLMMRASAHQIASSSSSTTSVLTNWQQLGTSDDTVDMADAQPASRNSRTPSGHEEVFLSKAQALSARQAKRFF